MSYELAWCHLSSLQPFLKAGSRYSLIPGISAGTGQVATPAFSRAEFNLRQDGSHCPPSLCNSLGFTFLFHKVAFCFYK